MARPGSDASPISSVTGVCRSSCARPPTSTPERRPRSVEHPIGLLTDLKFRVTVNTDNRLMSATTLSNEFAQLVEAFGIGWDRIRRLTINAMKSAFLPFDERVAFLDDVIRPAYLEHDR